MWKTLFWAQLFLATKMTSVGLIAVPPLFFLYTQIGHCNRLNYQSTQRRTCVVMEKPVSTCWLATHCSLWSFNMLFFICCLNKWHRLICLRQTKSFISFFLPPQMRSRAKFVLWLHLWTEHDHISLAGATKK